MHSMQCTLCNALYAMHAMQCTLCNALYAMHSMLCTLCYALYAMQSMLSNLCYAIYAMQSMLCNLCSAIYAMQSMLCTLCSAICAMQSMQCNLCYAIYAQMYIAKKNTLTNIFAYPTVAGFMLQHGGRNSWQQGFTLGKDKSLLGSYWEATGKLLGSYSTTGGDGGQLRAATGVGVRQVTFYTE